MRTFKWIAWNLDKIDAHSLTAAEVESAFDRVFLLQTRRDGSFRMFAEAPSGRRIWIVWRYDREAPGDSGIDDGTKPQVIFVITAY